MPISSERKSLRTSNSVHRRNTKTRISDNSAVTFKVKGQGRKVMWCVWQMLADKSRTKRPKKTKIGRRIVHPTSNNAPQIQGQRSRSSPGRLMLRPEVPHILRKGSPANFKLGTQTQYGDSHQRQVLWHSRSKIKVVRSRDASDRCWPISRERNVLETSKLVGRLHTSLAIMSASSKVKGQGHH